MNVSKSTRASLLGRLNNHTDDQAWSDFVEIYGPLIYRYGRRRGLQDADAADLAQDVLREIAGSIERFDYDPAVGRFRSWLFLITRRVLGRRLKAKKRILGNSGDGEGFVALDELPDRDAEDVWDVEYRRHLFRLACDHIQDEFATSTWAAFNLTAVEAIKPADAASTLGMSVGAVYVSKNRVLKRLREYVSRIDDSLELQ
ncbi:MAG: sigma-70 family RNA polymerase sigma factor [Planctomycetota bacterium]